MSPSHSKIFFFFLDRNKSNCPGFYHFGVGQFIQFSHFYLILSGTTVFDLPLNNPARWYRTFNYVDNAEYRSYLKTALLVATVVFMLINNKLNEDIISLQGFFDLQNSDKFTNTILKLLLLVGAK